MASLRHIYETSVSPWKTAVRVDSLHSTASSSDLYWTAELRVQRTCSVKQSATIIMIVTGCIQDKTDKMLSYRRETALQGAL